MVTSFVPLLAGLAGHVATVGAKAIQHSSLATRQVKLVELYPSLWTWLVPESLVGGLPYALVATVGFALLRTRQRFRALYH